MDVKKEQPDREKVLAARARQRAIGRELRRMYEPYVYSLSRYLSLPLPNWISERSKPDNWRTSAWERKSGHPHLEITSDAEDEHF